jgi:diacylglycerol kinase family enzyme
VAIVNPATRRDPARIIELLGLLAPASTELEICLTERAGHASELAREHAEGAEMLIAVGGDGTVGELAGVAFERGLDLGIIPAGSTNIIARELGIPTNPHKAVRLLFEPHNRVLVDAGTCGDRVFLHMAGAGLDSLMFDLTDPRLKRKMGWMAYVPAAAKALQRPLARYQVRAGGVSLDDVASPLVLVANGASIIAPSIVLDRGILYDDGQLDVMVVTATRPHELARVMARMATRQMRASPFVTHFSTTAVEIASDPPMAFQVDGDVDGTTPKTIGLRPAAVRIVTPLRAGRVPATA